eukprot:7957551-Ditylum_brightwellii.AAC.1
MRNHVFAWPLSSHVRDIDAKLLIAKLPTTHYRRHLVLIELQDPFLKMSLLLPDVLISLIGLRRLVDSVPAPETLVLEDIAQFQKV